MIDPTLATTLPIIQRLSAATPGPWRWMGNTQTDEVYLATTHSGRLTVLGFDRLGHGAAGPRFRGWRGRLRDTLRAAVRYDVLGQQTRAQAGVARDGHAGNSALYREQFVGIDHPDADLIAHAPEDLAALLLEVRRLSGEVERVTLIADQAIGMLTDVMLSGERSVACTVEAVAG